MIHLKIQKNTKSENLKQKDKPNSTDTLFTSCSCTDVIVQKSNQMKFVAVLDQIK